MATIRLWATRPTGPDSEDATASGEMTCDSPTLLVALIIFAVIGGVLLLAGHHG